MTQFIKKYNLQPKKKFGQNFLISDAVLTNIVKKSEFKQNDIVLEIGAGTGNLTQKLLPIVKQIIAIEIDKSLCEILKKENHSNIIIINEDILNLNLKELIKKYKINKIIGNLPYYIATKIIRELLNLPYKQAILMFQKEVAERIIAKANNKQYGILSVISQFYADVKIILKVKKENFFPKPKVDSSIIKFTPSRKIKVKDEKVFLQVVKAAFGHRRKTLINSLLQSLTINREKLINIFNQLNIPLNIRAENLSIKSFGELSDEFLKQNIKF